MHTLVLDTYNLQWSGIVVASIYCSLSTGHRFCSCEGRHYMTCWWNASSESSFILSTICLTWHAVPRQSIACDDIGNDTSGQIKHSIYSVYVPIHCERVSHGLLSSCVGNFELSACQWFLDSKCRIQAKSSLANYLYLVTLQYFSFLNSSSTVYIYRNCTTFRSKPSLESMPIVKPGWLVNSCSQIIICRDGPLLNEAPQLSLDSQLPKLVFGDMQAHDRAAL